MVHVDLRKRSTASPVTRHVDLTSRARCSAAVDFSFVSSLSLPTTCARTAATPLPLPTPQPRFTRHPPLSLRLFGQALCRLPGTLGAALHLLSLPELVQLVLEDGIHHFLLHTLLTSGRNMSWKHKTCGKIEENELNEIDVNRIFAHFSDLWSESTPTSLMGNVKKNLQKDPIPLVVRTLVSSKM